MSNSLKSKYLLGAMIVGAVFVGAMLMAIPSANAAYMHSTTLKMGSSGAQVTALQNALNMTSCKVGNSLATGYFGALTKAAVMCYQSANGLTADGVVGPMTGNAMGGVMSGNFPAGCTSAAGYSSTTGMPCNSTSANTFPAGCTSASGYSPTTGMKCDSSSSSNTGGPLMGGAGSLDDVETLSSLSDEEVAEGETNSKVAGWTLTADNGSDLSVTAFKLTFEQDVLNTETGSDKLDDYADKVTVWQGSTKVGEADVSDFSENSDVYSKTINLSSAVVKADKESDFFVAVDSASNIDSDDLGNNTWTVTLESVRVQDATGAILTDTSTGDLDGSSDVDFSFESVATADNVELKVSKTSGSSGDAINDGHVVEVDDLSDTNDVALLAFDLKATGEVKNIQDIPVSVVSTGTLGSVNEIASRFTLWMDGEEIDSVSVGDGTNDNYSTAFTEVTACAGTLTQGCTIHFDDVDFDMGDGDTSHFIVKADVNEVDGSPVAEGDGLTVTLTDTDADNIDAEDVNGDSLSTELTGSATSDGVAFNTEGISVKLVGTPTAVISHAADLTLITDDDQATWTVTFDVTAFGDDMRIDDESAEDTAAPYTTASQMSYSLSDSSKIAASPASIVTSPSGATHDTESFLVEEGTTERFTLSVTGTAAADGYSNMKLEAISWLAGATDGAGTQVYNFNLDDYKTADIYVNQN